MARWRESKAVLKRKWAYSAFREMIAAGFPEAVAISLLNSMAINGTVSSEFRLSDRSYSVSDYDGFGRRVYTATAGAISVMLDEVRGVSGISFHLGNAVVAQ